MKRIENLDYMHIVGKQGTGKTFSAVQFALQQRVTSFKCVLMTNIKSIKFADYYVENINDMIDLAIDMHSKGKKCIIFFDELFTFIQKDTSRKNASQILPFLAQLRKRNIIFITTVQEWAELPLYLRRFARFKIDCSNKSILGKLWGWNYVFDGENIKWDEQQQDFVGDLIQTNVFKYNKLVANLYDTYETINNYDVVQKNNIVDLKRKDNIVLEDA